MWAFIKIITVTIILLNEITALPYNIINGNGNSKRSVNVESENQDQLMVETVITDKKKSDDLSSTKPIYNYSYEVRDPTTGDDKQHEEKRDGDLVQGQYSLIEPDGSRRIVAYISNGTEGFNAIVLKINASELTLPMDDDDNISTTSTIPNESFEQYETTMDECQEPLLEKTKVAQQNKIHSLMEQEIPNESKIYMEDMEDIESKLLSEYKDELSTEQLNTEESQATVNFDNEPKQFEYLPDVEMEQMKKNETNSEIQPSQSTIAIPLTHIITYPMAIVQTPMIHSIPLYFHAIQPQSTENGQIQNDVSNSNLIRGQLQMKSNVNAEINSSTNDYADNNKEMVNDKKVQSQSMVDETEKMDLKKSRRHSQDPHRNSSHQDHKTIKLRVSYRVNGTKNHKSQVAPPQLSANRKVNEIVRNNKKNTKPNSGRHTDYSY